MRNVQITSINIVRDKENLSFERDLWKESMYLKLGYPYDRGGCYLQVVSLFHPALAGHFY